MTMSAFESSSCTCALASNECGSCDGFSRIEVTSTRSPPIVLAMSPYTLVDATTRMRPLSPSADSLAAAHPARAEPVSAATAVMAVMARKRDGMKTLS